MLVENSIQQPGLPVCNPGLLQHPPEIDKLARLDRTQSSFFSWAVGTEAVAPGEIA
jgi:hypothetical protein